MERVSFQGYNNNYATFKISGAVKTGNPVSLNSDGLCVKGGSGDALFGFCTTVRGSYATVQLQGYYESEFSGDVPEYGLNRFVYDSDGGVSIADDSDVAAYVKVVKVDEDNSLVGFIF